MSYGFLLFVVFAILSPNRSSRLFISRLVSKQCRAAVGGYFAWRFCPANFDFDLYLSKHGRGKRLVYRAFDCFDFDLFWRRQGNQPAYSHKKRLEN